MNRISPQQRKNLPRKLLRWYRTNRRNFHWRQTTDPYRICVSEIMLHQTQASRVNERFPEFIKEYPTIRALARATKADVIRSWRGLGYNNRAVSLWMLARTVLAEYGGWMPNEPNKLQQLPGIGKYTAQAIACFAFGRSVPVVDVNVHRVLSRIFWRANNPSDYKPINDIWQIAEQILPTRSAYNWNQGLMDLGATICVARRPLCNECPVANWCRSRYLARWKPKIKKTARLNQEPSYAGRLQRRWRGCVVDTLRQLSNGRMISLDRLGSTIKPDFKKSELPWLTGIVQKLERDRIIALRHKGRRTFVGLAHE